MVVALPAIWLVASEPSLPDTEPARSGLVDGVLAGLGFGTLFAALAQIPEESGFLPLGGQPAGRDGRDRRGGQLPAGALGPREPAAYAGAISGVLGALATGFFLLATQSGFLTIAAVITSLYPAFTVVLAFVVLRERVHRAQGIGLVLCAVAVGLVAGG